MRGALLLLDVVRQRGNNSIEHNACKAPNVLKFEAELFSIFARCPAGEVWVGADRSALFQPHDDDDDRLSRYRTARSFRPQRGRLLLTL
jgi:hypothetical protein